jgi:hypothetical protein
MALPIQTPLQLEMPGAWQSQPSAGALCLVKLPTGVTYALIALELTIAGVAATRAQIAAQIEYVRVKLSGNELWNSTPSQLMARDNFLAGVDTQTAYPGYLMLPIASTWEKDPADGMVTAMGTKDQSAVEIEVKMAAGATINAGAAYAIQDPVSQNTGMVARVIRLNPTLGLIGENTVIDVPPPLPGQRLARIIIQPPVVANFTQWRLMENQSDIIRVKPSFHNRICLAAGRLPQDSNGAIILDLEAYRGISGDTIDLSQASAQQLLLTFATAAPGTFPIALEYLQNVPAGN